jgi:hypothetical protein
MGSGKTQNLELIQFEFGKDRYHEQREMIRWCEQNFGLGSYYPDTDKNWHWNSMFGSTFFYFKDTKDAMIFSLKWS